MHKKFLHKISRATSWQRSFARRHPRFVTFLKLFIIFAIFWGYTWKLLDPDFGWHLTTGNYIRTHWLPTHDLYTYTAHTFPWIDHEWANDVLVSFLYQWGGFVLLTTVFAALWTTALGLFRKRLQMSVLLLALLALLPYVGVRPIIWTILGVTILLELAARNSKSSRRFIPLLLLVWVNLHGGFIIGLSLVTYFLVFRYRNKQWLGLLVVCVAVSFINPYGPRLYVEIARTLFDPALHRQITEWRYFALLPTTWAFIVVWGVGFWLYDHSKVKNWLATSPLLLLASLSASRNMPLFVISGLRDIDGYSDKFKLPAQLDRPRRVLVNGTMAIIVIIIGVYLCNNFSSWAQRETNYPRQAVVYLAANGCAGNLFNDYNYGGYLIWKLPQIPVYIDGRMPSWRDSSGQKYLTRYFDAIDHPVVLKKEFSQYNIRCALLRVGRDSKAIDELHKEKWTIVDNQRGILLMLAPRKE